MQNNHYNLMMQLTEEHKSLWRIKNEYLKDADGDTECKALWEKLAKQKEEMTKEIEAVLKSKMV